RDRAERALAAAEAELAAVERDWRLRNRVLDVRRPSETPAYRATDSGAVARLTEPSADEQVARAFRDWGLDVDATPTAEAAARLKARPAVIVEAVAALDEWARERPAGAGQQRLADLAAALDDAPESWRRELRGILARRRLPLERALGEVSAALLPWS